MTDLVLGTENKYGLFGDSNLRILNPFPACPNSPNCLRVSVQSTQPISSLKDIFENYIHHNNALILEFDEKTTTYHIEWNTGLFKDDLWFQLVSQSTGTSIHMKSASRIGFSDLGVNPRRVQELLKVLELESDLTKFDADFTSF